MPRHSVSLSAATFHRLRSYSEACERSMSSLLETILLEFLDGDPVETRKLIDARAIVRDAFPLAVCQRDDRADLACRYRVSTGYQEPASGYMVMLGRGPTALLAWRSAADRVVLTNLSRQR